MLIGWKYKPRNTLIQAIDPRARLIFMVCMLGAIVQAWDLRWLLGLFSIAALQYGLARLSLRETRRFWLFAGPVALVLTLLTAITGQGIPSSHSHPGLHTWLHVEAITISKEQAFFAAAQLVRVLAIGLLAVVVPFTIDPALYGVTFRGLGLGDRLAFAMDLSFRFVPSLAGDFASAMDAQKARGYELDARRGSPITRIRRIAPLIIPVTINAMVSAEETVDAMDLRGFGVRPRTWYPELTWHPRDSVILGSSLLLLAGVTTGHLLGYTAFWVPI